MLTLPLPEPVTGRRRSDEPQAAPTMAAGAPGPFARVNIVVVVPAYNESGRIGDVLRALPAYVRRVIVVDDASSDGTAAEVQEVAAENSRVLLIRHDRNQGVGGATVSGFRRALEEGADIVVKMDGDGQMPAAELPRLLRPLISGEADYVKGNRFHDFRALARMPLLRRAGNMGLSFLAKAATGYWNCFDPSNGYVAIRAEVLAELPLEKLDRTFFFETSLLARLNLLNAVVRDVPMPARYGDKRSHLSVRRVLVQFPPRLLYCLLRRIVLKNFLYDFSLESLYLLAGIPMLLAGVLYGLGNWISYAAAGIGAPTGTVVIPAMLIILGFQLLLAAIGEDVRNVPSQALYTRHGSWDAGRPAAEISLSRGSFLSSAGDPG